MNLDNLYPPRDKVFFKVLANVNRTLSTKIIWVVFGKKLLKLGLVIHAPAFVFKA